MKSTDGPSREPRHPIGVVAQRTGLSSHVLRAWERRYGVVRPGRSNGGHRLYSDADVERLRILHRLTQGERQIGQLAELSTEALAELLHQDLAADVGVAARAERKSEVDERRAELNARAWGAVEALDADALGRILRQAALTLSTAAYVDDFLLPLMERIGEAWAEESLTPAHEHLASAVAARVTGWLVGHFDAPVGAPSVVITTPAGHRHELGAIAAAVISASEGWRVHYLGPDLPARDVALAARRTGARAVALSIVFPADDPATAEELRTLIRVLPVGTAVFVGGRASDSYAKLLRELGIVRPNSFRSFRAALSALSRAEAAGGT